MCLPVHFLGLLTIEKVAFGTATPFMDYASGFARTVALTEADAAAKEKLYSRNAKRILGL